MSMIKSDTNVSWRFTGIINGGNTCFLNSALQFMFRITPITNYIRNTRESNPILNELKIIIFKKCL